LRRMGCRFAQQSQNAGDELAEGAPHASLSSGDPPGAAVFAWSLVDAPGRGFQPSHPTALSAGLYGESGPVAGQSVSRVAGGAAVGGLGAAAIRSAGAGQPGDLAGGRWQLRCAGFLAWLTGANGRCHPLRQKSGVVQIARALCWVWPTSQLWGTSADPGRVAEPAQGLEPDRADGARPPAKNALSTAGTLLAGR
jgi:hypothetical protein